MQRPERIFCILRMGPARCNLILSRNASSVRVHGFCVYVEKLNVIANQLKLARD